MKITRIIRMVKNRIMQSTDPVGWARKIGVNFPGGVTPLWKNELEH